MASVMRAVVYERYGPPEVLELREVARPVPGRGEVLVKVRATTVSSGDHRARSLDVPRGFGPLARLVFGFSRPRQPVLGTELAGDVVEVGRDVRSFAVGDPVVVFADVGMGCHAEYRCMREDGAIVAKPPNLSYEQAAALSFGGTTALHFLRKANLRRGERVLVNGASGSVGTACVQLARHLGAEVTGVCSTANLELVRSLGAAHVIDHTREDFTRAGRVWDVIVDTVGTAPFSRSKAALAEGGRLLLVFASLASMLGAPFRSMSGKRKVVAGVALGKREDLLFLSQLASAGELTPVVDRCYPLEEIVEAHRYVDGGRKRGNVVVRVGA